MSGIAGGQGTRGRKWSQRYFHDDQSNNADEAEWKAVLGGAAHVSAGTVDDEMSEAADQDTFPDARSDDKLEGKNVIQEAVQGPVAEIVQERARLLGDAYPFELQGNSLSYRPAERPVYELMLGITQAPSLTSGDYVKLPRLFETLSALAGRGWLGHQARHMRTGWPRPDTCARFKSLVESLRRSAAHPDAPEWQWGPDADLPDDPAPALVKEGGLDLVVWRHWDNDQRGGQFYLLGQCACGKDWMDKGQDIELRILERWLRLPKVPPVRALFVPRYVVPSLMTDITVQAGLVFDRVRIVHALRSPFLADELDALQGDLHAALAIAKAAQRPVGRNPRRLSPRRRATPVQQP